MTRLATTLLLALLTTVSASAAMTLIRGGEGNMPLTDPGWPKGAAALFNHEGRVAWWEGPPFGGGQWHSECRGDVKALNAVLADFARFDAITKRVVIHDGAGRSFWLGTLGEPEKKADARVDWTFMVWQPASWDSLRKLPADLNPTDPKDLTPPSQIDIYTSHIRWADVVMPEGLEVIDNRLEAHGFTSADGSVIEGKVIDLQTQKPVVSTVKLQRVEPQKTGGYQYPVVAETKADDQGRWVVKKAPTGWLRVVVEAPGYVARVAGYEQLDDQPRWHSHETGLTRSAPVAGRVTDESGKPLPDVQVSLGDVAPGSGGRYESPSEYKASTDADGRFRIDQVPVGKATVWVNKPGYVRPGLGQEISTPKDDVALKMIRAASIKVSIDFGGNDRPEAYIVKMAPEGGEVVGSHGGSATINADNWVKFENVPPGRYEFRGRPNPGADSQETEPVTLDLKGGETTELTLKAR